MGYSDLKELLVDARNLAEGAHDLQLKEKLLDIQGLIYDLQDENRELRLKIEEMENNQFVSSEIEYKDDAYYRNDEGPYCTNCWDVKQKLIRLSKLSSSFSRIGTHKCPNCETPYVIKQ